MSRLNLTQSCASSPDNSLSDKSFLMLYMAPSIRYPHILPSSHLYTCPYHFKQFSCTFLDISPTFAIPLIISLLILSSLATPLIHLTILISTTFKFSNKILYNTYTLSKSAYHNNTRLASWRTLMAYFVLAYLGMKKNPLINP